jgi:hypothetical protein
MKTDLVGRIIRCHTEEKYFDVGRIVHVDHSRILAYFIPCPSSRTGSSGYKSWYVPAARTIPITSLNGSTRDEDLNGLLTLVDFVAPPQWRLTDTHLHSGVCLNGLVGKRAQIKKWLEERQERQRWIAPIIENYSIADLLEFGAFHAAVCQRTKELEHKDVTKVRRVLLMWMLGCGDPNALLPWKFRRGGKGGSKEFTAKPGRPPKDFKAGIKTTKGYVTSLADRENLAKGWRRYKKQGVSVYSAYLQTCAQYWPGAATIVANDGQNLALAVPDERPTQAEFRNAAMKRGATSARRINLGEHIHALCERELRGSSKSGVRAVGQLALIDATPEDQTPVSSVSSLIVLPTTYRTVVMDVRTEYILGVYSGFENPSTLTSLLAILSAASSKVEFCARYGITITDDEWFIRMPKAVRGDNGELKSQRGIGTLTLVGTSLEFTASYAAILKSLVEACHHSMHAYADHLAAGSNKGRRRSRGEPDRKDDACRTFEQNMYFVILAILRHNNEDPVPHLLTPQMVRDDVEATRAAIYRWYVENGYIASAPTNIDSLRTRCLPSLAGVIHREGVWLYNPIDPRELIDGLVFNSPWLQQSGLCIKSTRRAAQRQVEIKMSPNELGHCFFEYGGELHRLENQSLDAESRGLSLLEYLQFSENRKSAGRALRPRVEEFDQAFIKENNDLNKAAKKAKATEARDVVEQGGQVTLPRKQSLRDNLSLEKKRHYMRRLGLEDALDQAQKVQPEKSSAGADIAAIHESSSPHSAQGHPHTIDVKDATATLMERYRQSRQFID